MRHACRQACAALGGFGVVCLAGWRTVLCSRGMEAVMLMARPAQVEQLCNVGTRKRSSTPAADMAPPWLTGVRLQNRMSRTKRIGGSADVHGSAHCRHHQQRVADDLETRGRGLSEPFAVRMCWRTGMGLQTKRRLGEPACATAVLPAGPRCRPVVLRSRTRAQASAQCSAAASAAAAADGLKRISPGGVPDADGAENEVGQLHAGRRVREHHDRQIQVVQPPLQSRVLLDLGLREREGRTVGRTGGRTVGRSGGRTGVRTGGAVWGRTGNGPPGCLPEGECPRQSA